MSKQQAGFDAFGGSEVAEPSEPPVDLSPADLDAARAADREADYDYYPEWLAEKPGTW